MPKYNNERNFWDRVDIQSKDECWLWSGKPSPNGYGRFRLRGICYYVHVFSYKLHNNDYNKELDVSHECFNKLCVNPHHLKLVPHRINTQEPDFAKLNWKKVRYIRANHLSTTMQTLANLFLVSIGAIQAVIEHRSWREDVSA